MSENEDPPKPEGFDTSDTSSSDPDLTPPEGRPVDKDLDHAALLEQGKRIAALEQRVVGLEGRLDEELHLVRRLRKLMAAWTSDL
jgi:hypothetical protein